MAMRKFEILIYRYENFNFSIFDEIIIYIYIYIYISSVMVSLCHEYVPVREDILKARKGPECTLGGHELFWIYCKVKQFIFSDSGRNLFLIDNLVAVSN
jgi:hypothetical protein